jgi:hypothetical protein
MTKYLSHYYLYLILKEYLLNETQGKVYASVVFVPLLRSLSAVHFLNRRCTIKKLSVWTRDAKWKWRYLKMLCTVKPGMLYDKIAQKILHYTAGLISCLVNTTTYNSQRVLCIEYEQHADLLTIISMTIAHKKNNRYLPMHYVLFVKTLHS